MRTCHPTNQTVTTGQPKARRAGNAAQRTAAKAASGWYEFAISSASACSCRGVATWFKNCATVAAAGVPGSPLGFQRQTASATRGSSRCNPRGTPHWYRHPTLQRIGYARACIAQHSTCHRSAIRHGVEGRSRGNMRTVEVDTRRQEGCHHLLNGHHRHCRTTHDVVSSECVETCAGRCPASG